ncbi:MAG TPA: BTAD domain-containing putative transcriptional regulator [Patescibacteria group bacterium]|nr:BTAD domain-containing putative transcriptional regulator [Patescibacteria group bacterium]
MAPLPSNLATASARRARTPGRDDLVAVGPGRPARERPPLPVALPGGGAGTSAPAVSELDVFGFPVQIGKVQPPLLPEETLERQRLLDWMAAKIHSRLVLIVADAGHGKTTLLADWSRRTRVRTLWYRLDETDRDWVVFVNHVVAAGREIDPEFAPSTMSLIGELGAGMGDRAAIVRTLLAEIRAWVSAGTALLLDDYQVVDDVPEIREIVRELLVRGPERLTLVISTRQGPTLPLARLRALGETAELTTADLRFDRNEMERLFRETYRHPLEADLLEDLARTTEGWAATLRLVETAVRGRPRDEIRAVIRSLSGRHGDLHDYLAEEVIGRMPVELQAFLERCALLHVATPQLAATAAGVSLVAARRLLDVTEEAGLLSRRGRTGQAGRLLHPLVRSFLEGRLLEAVGSDGIAEIHARIAAVAEANSWWLAGHHYAAAGRGDDVARVLTGSLEAILGAGGAQAAVDLIAAGGVADEAGWAQALAARSFLREGDIGRARDAAGRALAASTEGDPTISLTVALATLTTVEFNAGAYPVAVGYAERLREAAPETLYANIAESILSLSETMIDGCIAKSERAVAMMAGSAQRLGHLHYVGISHLNLAWLARGTGDAPAALRSARLALDALASTSAGPEMDTVRTVAAWGHAHAGDTDATLTAIDEALASPFTQGRFETLLEAADVVGAYVDPDRGGALLAEAEAVGARTDAERTCLALLRAETLIRLGLPEDARAALDSIAEGQHSGYPGFYVRVRLARALAAFLAGSAATASLLAEARAQAELQGASGTLRAIQLLESLAAGPSPASSAITALWSVEPGVVTALAEAVLARLGTLDDGALEVVRQAAARRPSRWQRGLRLVVERGPARGRWAAGSILDLVGEKSDVRRLRALSRELKGVHRDPLLGRDLARRTADRVWVEDQGRVIVRVGDRVIPGTDMRRKPLALLCFLLSRPGMSATRDQVLDALWPDNDPDQAVNSLHQTVYFLRRIIEPAYSDDLSPGYLSQDTELIWLDCELIASRSVHCKDLMRGLGPEPPVPAVLALAGEYRGKFALDFSYDDWASLHRDSLHAQYLEVMERAIAFSTASGRFSEAMELSRALLETDPSLDQVEASLVKMYRLLGAHAAAAEQYQHYTTVVRDELGIEPPPLDQM